ncbi:MAG: PAS domain S-box protein, partial [Chitinophagaceae bacterium]
QLLAQTRKFDEFVDIFTVSPEIHCILARDGKILFINDAVTTLLGYSVEEVTGHAMWNYCYHEDIEKTIFVIERGLKTIDIILNNYQKSKPCSKITKKPIILV